MDDFEVRKWTNYMPMYSVEDVRSSAKMFTDEWLGACERPTRYSWQFKVKIPVR